MDAIWYLITVTFLFLHLHGGDSIFVTEWPISVAAYENDTVDFFCEVREKADWMHLVWFTDMEYGDNKISLTFANDTVELNLENKGGQHSIDYEENSGVYKLKYRIADIKVADEGFYACGFVPLPLPPSVSGENVLGEVASLEVLIPPLDSHPRCELAGLDLMQFTNSSAIGLPVEFRCEIRGGRPTSDLTWYRNNKTVATGTEVNLLQHTLSSDDNGVEFVCMASGKALMTNTSCSITPLRIQPTVTLSSSSEYVTSGANVTLTCIGEGLPYISEIEWFVDGVSTENLDDIDLDIFDEQSGSAYSSELFIFFSNFEHKYVEIECSVKIPSGLQTTTVVTLHNRANNTQPSLIKSLLPVIAGTSGLLVLTLIIVLGICLCKGLKREQTGDDNDIYQGGDIINTHSNTYQEGVTNDIYDGDGYVINQIPGGLSQGRSVRSDHPYADINMNYGIYDVDG